MPFLVFENPGEIDPLAITTMGINVKQQNNSIGTFGTGLKYAIANILRYNGTVFIQSGLSEMEFSKSPQLVRGQEFDFIKIKVIGPALEKISSGILGFTTELGKHWQIWMAYRELYSNCQDEKGTIYIAEDILPAKENITRIIVDCDPFFDAHEERAKFFLSERKLEKIYETPSIEIYNANSREIFYQGIKITDTPINCYYTYNIKRKISLTEDRTYPIYSAFFIIAEEILSRKNPPIDYNVLLNIINPPSNLAEDLIQWPTHVFPRPEILTTKKLNKNLYNVIKIYLPRHQPEKTRFDDFLRQEPPHKLIFNTNKLKEMDLIKHTNELTNLALYWKKVAENYLILQPSEEITDDED